MQNLPIPVILEAVKTTGKLFLQDYKQSAIPGTMDELLIQLKYIEDHCYDSLKSILNIYFPETPWIDDDEFDSEAQRKPAALEEYWLCDTMDGAIQYIQHLPGWTINLALIRHGEPYFSIIYDPLSDELFWAQKNGGAFMNNNRLTPSRKINPELMLAVFEYGHQKKTVQQLNQIGSSVTDLISTFGMVRNYGPHGLQLAYVGAGRIDLFLQEDLDTHNWIAGILIAQEAGAEILTIDGRAWKWGDENLLVATKEATRTFLSVKNKTQKQS